MNQFSITSRTGEPQGDLANSDLLATVTGPVHTVTWEPNRDVLASKQNKAGSSVISQYNYVVHAIGQRTAVTTSGSAFQYGAQSRRIAKTTGTNKNVFLYNGWNSIADYSLSSNQFTFSHTHLWGSDLSGSMQGAGGVGGLLLITDHSALITSHYATYDGNGNISEYLTTTGTLAAPTNTTPSATPW